MPRKKLYASTTARIRAFRARQAAGGKKRFEVALDQATVAQIERLRTDSPQLGGASMTDALDYLIWAGLNSVSSNENSVSGNVSGT